MPELDGLALLRKLSELNYDGAIVLMTGEGEAILQSAETLASRYGHWILGVTEKPVTAKKCQSYIEKAEFRQQSIAQCREVLLTQYELEQAIESGWLTLYFQPQLNISTLRVSGFEALVRINHPKYGLLTPDSFIAIAEVGKNIHSLTEYVVNESLDWTRRFHKAGYPTTISINLSSKVLEDQAFPLRLLQRVKDKQLSPELVICELTETLLATDPKLVLESMARLQLYKFKLSIDDFGTGFSSFEQLHDLPFNELKVDKCFVRECDINEKSNSILENSLRLASDLKLNSVAEGVETEACLNRLAALGCTTAQGYHISRPIPATEVCEWLAENYTPI